eukprot:CAMPEP_0168721560 /NCGR_PEP_ID=MMETSP0724-20121128/2146_1 /TAXON_ID=265536 /ORGANISM="Amphiprora sp., Strain CCMP467" /LENGTH=498 /DNA_ID=CAMNT_0008768207 /DNA_START=48 /DNA_END=1544 /DNA_ORIENTATION=-
MKDRLGKIQAKQLERWIECANVPLSAEATEQALRDFQAPKNVERFLIVQNSIASLDGNYFLPNVESYCDRYKRIENTHYFSKYDPELFRSKLRSWTLVPVKKGLSLWAATSKRPLEQFNASWAKEFYEHFQYMEEEEWNTEQADLSEGDYNGPLIQAGGNKGGEVDGLEASTTSESTGNDDETSGSSKSLLTQNEDSREESKPKKQSRVKPVWYADQPQDEEIIPILKKLGFTFQQRVWSHPDARLVCRELDDLRKLIVFCGIPTRNDNKEDKTKRASRRSAAPKQDILKEKLDKEEHKLIWKWLLFTYFPNKMDGAVLARLHELDQPISQNELKKRLASISFELDDSNFFPPGSDEHLRAINQEMYENDLKNGRVTCFGVSRIHGLHLLATKEELIHFLFAAPCLYISKRFREQHDNEASKGTEMFLRLWAISAAVKMNRPMALPQFSETSPLFKFAMDSLGSGEIEEVEMHEVLDLTSFGTHVLECTEESDVPPRK